MKNENQLQVREKESVATVPDHDLVTLPASSEVASYFKGASMLQLTKEETEALSAPFDESLIEIRPDGFIYLPQTFYRQRLNQVLGIGQWALVTKGSYQAGSKLFLNGILVIRGNFVAESTGEAAIIEENANQSLATVWESAKSDCITRCCKDLSMASQVYQPAYMREWQKKHAIQVWIEGKLKPQWRKTDSDPFFKEKGPVEQRQHRDAFPHEHPDNNKPWLNDKFGNGGVTGDWIRVTKALSAGEMTIDDVKKEFRVSGKIMEMLKNCKPVAAAEAGTEPKISGSWYAILDKCKTKQDVDAEALKHKASIDSTPGLRQLFVDRRAALPSLQKTTA